MNYHLYSHPTLCHPHDLQAAKLDLLMESMEPKASTDVESLELLYLPDVMAQDYDQLSCPDG